MKVKKKYVDLPFAADSIPDGAQRALLRSSAPQTIKGKKTFAAYPKVTGEADDPHSITTKGAVDAAIGEAPVTRSHVFTVTEGMVADGGATLPVEIVGNKMATRLKIEGSYGPVMVSPNGESAADGFRVIGTNQIDWSENDNAGRIRAGDRAVIQYQGYAVGELLPAKNQISCGNYCTLFAFETGEAMAVGRNLSGELGLGYVSEWPDYVVSTLTAIPAGFSFAEIAAAAVGYSMAVSRTGRLYCAGNFLAASPPTINSTFTDTGLSNIVSARCTDGGHAIALTADGEIYTAGSNTYGQLGRTGDSAFAKVDGLSSVKEIAISYHGSFALTTDGKLYVAGENEFNGAGMLGLGATISVSVFTEVTGLPTIAEIIGAPYGAFAIGTDGKVYATGCNDTGMLGFGDTTNRTTFSEVPGLSSIVGGAAAIFHALMFDSSGNLYVCGSNEHGRIGLGATASVDVFNQITGMSGVTAASASGSSSFVIVGDVVYCTGRNNEAQLGFGDTTQRTVFTSLFEIGG